jgi:UPF0271 protein
MTSIDLNADVGEMDIELDARIIEVVSSVNIACGGHAGDDTTMTAVAVLASQRGIRIGAHPSYVDRERFGRAHQHVAPGILRQQIREQIGRLAANSPTPLAYVKPHGALYHRAAVDPDVAQALVDAADGLPLMGQGGAEYLRLAAAAGVPTIHEGFADRAYTDGGRLVPRGEDGAVLAAEHAVLEQVAHLAEGRVRTVTGRVITVLAQSVCVHSDTPGAADLAHRIAAHLRAAGIEIRP